MEHIRTRWSVILSNMLNQAVLLRDRPLVAKLLVYSALLVVIPMMVVGIISFNRSSTVLEEETSQASWQIIEQVKTHVEYYVRDMESDMLSMVNHPAMTALISMRTPEEVRNSGIRGEVLQLMRNMAYSRNDISHVTVIMDNVAVLDTEEVRSVYPAAGMPGEYWYPLVPQVGDLIISRIIAWPDKKEPVLTIARRLVNPRTLESVGMLVVDINYKRLQEIADKVTVGRTGYMSILDLNSHYVYHPDLSQLGKQADYNVTSIMESDEGTFRTRGQGGAREFLTFSRSYALNWHFVTSVPYGELMQGRSYIGKTIIWAIVITLLAAYGIGIAFASSLVVPIRRMERYMKKVVKGDFTGTLQVDSRDEIGLLAQGLTDMVGQLVKLLDEVYESKLRETRMMLHQRETELKVLESQINPHFLYNSLETIRGMALDRGMEDISVMASSLARLLRYNLKNSSPIVTLKEELDNCEIYLKIQKYRFEEKLEYRFDVPAWLEDKQVPKFSLQPIIENCVIHGIEASLGTVMIRVSAFTGENGESFVLEIADTGPGIQPFKLRKIRDDISIRDISEGGSQIGLINVHRRIAHLFGEAYGVEIGSKPDECTWVRLRLPLGEGKTAAKTNDGG